MNYALVEDGIVKTIGLPQTGTLKDGSTVSGYNLLDAEILIDEGWLPLVDEPPTYNTETHLVSQDGYIIEADQVVQKYKIIDKVTNPTTPSLEERIAQLVAENEALTAEAARLAQRDSQMQDDQMLIMETLINAGILV
jgi:hypothetical protein